MFSREQDIIQTLRLIENLKLTLLDNVSSVYHAMTENSSEAIKTALANTIVHAYILGRRLGIDYSELESKATAIAKRRSLAEDDIIEDRFGDFSDLARFLPEKRR